MVIDPYRYNQFVAFPDNNDVLPLVEVSPRLAAERTRVILSIGNSMYCNSIRDATRTLDNADLYVPANDGVQIMSLKNGGLYRAREPLINIGVHRLACVLTTLGDLLISSGQADRVILAPVAVNGVFMARFADLDDLGNRYIAMLRRLAARDLYPTEILLGGAENEAFAGGAWVTGYASVLTRIIANLRAAGATAPIYIARSTYSAHAVQTGAAALLAAINSVVNGTTERLGVVMDDLGDNYRADGTHLDYTHGRPTVAARWCDLLSV
jgi:hypothetical protein